MVNGLTSAKVDSGDLGVQDIQNDSRMQYSVPMSALKVRGELVTRIMREGLSFSDSQIKTPTLLQTGSKACVIRARCKKILVWTY